MLELFRIMWVGWQRFARGIMTAQNVVLMGIAWALGLGPVALVAKLVGHRFLDRAAPDPAASSHWRARDPAPMDMKRAARPF